MTYNDGSANAPAGTPELPNLLAGLAATPPWQVAGVNYYVGVPQNLTLLNPDTISMAGVSVNANSHTITITGNNVTLNGYDFSLNGGWGIAIASGVTNTTIENSNFLVGSNQLVPIRTSTSGVGNLTVLNDTFNGGSYTSPAAYAMVSYYGGGTFTSEYCSYLNTPEDAIDFSPGKMTAIVEYNLFQNLGTSPGAHADTVQFYNTDSNNSVISFNTVTSGEEGIQYDAQDGSTLSNGTIDNNTIVAQGPATTISYLIAAQETAGPNNIINGLVVESNYLDYAGAYGPFYPSSGTNLTYGDNINMTTGATIANPAGTTAGGSSGAGPGTGSGTGSGSGSGTGSGSGSSPNPTAAADKATTEENQSVTIAVLSVDTDTGGTLNPGSVTVSTAPANGKAAVNATTGAITYTPAAGFFGTDTFQYTVADTSGTVSAPGTVTVTVDAPPVAASDDPSTPENTPVTINVLSADSDAVGTINPASVTVNTVAAHGTTSVNSTTGAITYTPAAGYTGSDTFHYTVANTLGGVSSPGTVTVDVTSSGTGTGTGTGSGTGTGTGTPPVGSSGYVDGSSGAPAGTPQLPTILSGYAVRPPWEVAGVDYAVGVPTGTSLLDPSTISMSGVSVSASNHTVTVSGNNVTLKGYDFGLDNGWQVIVKGANDTIEDSEFVVGSNQPDGNTLDVTSSASNFSLLDNQINGNNVAVTSQQGQTASFNSSGSLTIEYNYMYDSGGDMLDFGPSSVPQIDVVQYNVFENIGVNTPHADTLQWYDTTTGAGSDIGFNTVYDDAPMQNGNGAIVPLAEGPTATMTGLTVNNNTIIQTAADDQANFSTGFYADEGGTASDVVIHDNYADPSGVLEYTGSPWFPTGSYHDDLAQPTAELNLIDMVTGAVIPVPSAATATEQGYYTYADGAGYSPALSDVYSVKASQTSGTLVGGNTVTFTLTMDEPFTVTGAAALTLNDGGTATYVSGSGTTTLVFSYTVASGNTAVSSLGITGVSLPTGASIKDAVGNAANMAGAVASFSGLAVTPGSGSGTGTGTGSSPDPVAGAASATTEEGKPTTISVLTDDTDTGGTLNAASVAISTAAGHGTATVNTTTGAITYTPTAGYFGIDTFQYTVADTSGVRSAPATVTVTVDAPPTTAADSATTTENEAVSIAVLGKDSDAVGTINPASVAISTAPAHGTTSVNATTGAITYTPAAGYTGTDTFQYTVANTLGGVSAPATVTVAVNSGTGTGSGSGTGTGTGTGSAPVAGADSGVTEENQAVTIAVLSNDTDTGGTINPGSVAVSTAAAHGTTSVNPTTGAITYTPAAAFSGTDTFQYTVANTLGDASAPATVTVTVDAPPKAAADSATTPENQPVTISVLSNDSDPVGTINPDSVAISAAAAHGTTAINPTTGAITYTPAAGYSGTDTFQYTVANTEGGVSAPATVSVTVSSSSTGGGSPPPPPPNSGYADGSSGAPAGTPQLPTILSGYTVRPPWEVAGVDYAVGMQVPAGAALLDPSTISMTGVSVNAASHTVTITGNNVTLNGYDFSGDGGWKVDVTGRNDTIENSNFAVGANELVPIVAGASSTNLSVLYNTIDGGGDSGNPSAITALISDTGTGLTVEYNWLKNAPQTVIAVKGGTLIDEFNLVEDVGFGASSPESDLTFSGGVSHNSVISFNTFYNPPHAGEPTNLASGLQIEAQNGATLINTEAENNTIISPGPALTNTYLIAIYQDRGSNIVKGVNVELNYLDFTGADAAYFPITSATRVAFVNNVNLDTGSTVPGIPDTASSNVVNVAITPGSGTATVGSPITIAVTMNEAMTVSGAPTLSLNDGGTATYSEGSGTKTLTFTTTVNTSDVAVSALAVTGVNLPAGSIIVDAAGDSANLSGVTQTPTGSPAVSSTALQASITPSGSSSPSSTPATASSAVLGVSGNSLAFIAPVSGSSATGQTASAAPAPDPAPDWLSVAAVVPGTGHTGDWQCVTGLHPTATSPNDPLSTIGTVPSVSSTWTSLPLASMVNAAMEEFKAAGQ